jgi:hypothetical protein
VVNSVGPSDSSYPKLMCLAHSSTDPIESSRGQSELLGWEPRGFRAEVTTSGPGIARAAATITYDYNTSNNLFQETLQQEDRPRVQTGGWNPVRKRLACKRSCIDGNFARAPSYRSGPGRLRASRVLCRTVTPWRSGPFPVLFSAGTRSGERVPHQSSKACEAQQNKRA